MFIYFEIWNLTCLSVLQVRLLCWWTVPVLPPWSPVAHWSASSLTGPALNVSWVPAQTYSNVTSNSTTALFRCLSEGASFSLLSLYPSPSSLLSDPGSTNAICFLSLSSCFLFAVFSIPSLFYTHTDHLLIPPVTQKWLLAIHQRLYQLLYATL